MLKNAIVFIFSLWTGLLYAQTGTEIPITSVQALSNLDLRLPASSLLDSRRDYESEPLLVVAAAEDPSVNANQSKDRIPSNKFEEKMFTGNKIHKYFGIGSVGAALLTIIAPKGDTIHENLAKTSAILGAGAVATGFIYHYEDISTDGGLRDPDNIHALSAGLGAVGIALAASIGPDVPHATYGALGTIGMVLGIKYTW